MHKSAFQILILLSMCDAHFPKHGSILKTSNFVSPAAVGEGRKESWGSGGEAIGLVKALPWESIKDILLPLQALFSGKQILEITCGLKEHPSAELWQAHLMLALRAACFLA